MEYFVNLSVQSTWKVRIPTTACIKLLRELGHSCPLHERERERMCGMGRFLAAFLALSVLGATCTAEEATNRLCKYEVVMMVGEYILLTLFF